jgi:hypothetical protein
VAAASVKPRRRYQRHTEITLTFFRPTSKMNCRRFNSVMLMLRSSLLQISLHFGMTSSSRYSRAVFDFKVSRFIFAQRNSIFKNETAKYTRLKITQCHTMQMYRSGYTTLVTRHQVDTRRSGPAVPPLLPPPGVG